MHALGVSERRLQESPERSGFIHVKLPSRGPLASSLALKMASLLLLINHPSQWQVSQRGHRGGSRILRGRKIGL